MLIVYASRQGKTEELVHALQQPNSLKIETGQEKVSEPFVLLTYTDKTGEIPEQVELFLKQNAEQLKAVVATGSIERHYETFCFAGQKIALEHKVPLLSTVNGRGSKADEEKILEALSLLS